MSGNGWCTHPDRQVSSDVRILVRKAELACRNAWGSDLWEPANAEDAPAAQPANPVPDRLPSTPVTLSYDDEVTSVVAADEHARQRGRLDDEVVEQTTFTLHDDEYDADQDERRNLWYRDSRSAIERARQRHLKRSVAPLRSDDEDTVIETTDDAAPATTEKPTFEPDDFVEEETPQVVPVDEHDDALISEGIRTPSPRARRLRRFRDGQQGPKEAAAAKTEPEPDVVEPELPPSAAPERGRFDSIPEISAEFELPLLRRPSSAPDTTLSPEVEATPAASSYDRALKRAHDLGQATRLEHNQQRRREAPSAMPGGSVTMPDIPDVTPEPGSPRATLELPASPASTSALLHPRADVERVEKADGRTRIQPRNGAPERPRATEPLAPTPDARQSWWRGAKQASEAPAAPEAPAIVATPRIETLDLRRDEDLEAFRSRVFANGPAETPAVATAPAPRNPISLARRERRDGTAGPARRQERRAPIHHQERQAPVRKEERPAPPRDPEPISRPQAASTTQHVPADKISRDRWYTPEELPAFDVRDIIEGDDGLLDMQIEIGEGVDKACGTCRNYRPGEQPGRGWCTNNWAFTHRQMVNETDLACTSTIGCWWLPADENVWLDEFEVAADATPRVDRLLARLHPDRRAVGNE